MMRACMISALSLIAAMWAHSCNAAINATLQPLTTTTILEGGTVTIQTSIAATTGEHILGGSASYNPGGAASIVSGPGGFSLPHGPSTFTSPPTTFLYQDNGSFTLQINGSGATHNASHAQVWSGTFGDTQAIQVVNVAPTITSISPNQSVLENQFFAFSAAAIDPGILDILTFDWDLDGDSLFDDFTGPSGTHSFATAGLYTVGLRVSDGDGGFDFASFGVNVSSAPQAAVPEPASLLAWSGLGIAGLVLRYRRRRRVDV